MQIKLAAAPSVTTRNIGEFAERLGETANADGLLINVSELEEVDLTFVQVIDVYRADFARSGRSFALSAHDNDSIASLLSRCGYLEGAEPSDVAFWIGEETE